MTLSWKWPHSVAFCSITAKWHFIQWHFIWCHSVHWYLSNDTSFSFCQMSLHPVTVRWHFIRWRFIQWHLSNGTSFYDTSSYYCQMTLHSVMLHLMTVTCRDSRECIQWHFILLRFIWWPSLVEALVNVSSDTSFCYASSDDCHLSRL